MSRLFIGLQVPKEAHSTLENVKAIYAGDSGIRRLIPKEHYHITLKFLGEVNIPAREKLIKELSTVHQAPFQVFLTHVSGFPTPQNPSTIFVGCEKSPELMQLAIDVDTATKIIKAEFKFTPHITIARTKDKIKMKNKSVQGGSFYVDEFILYESKLLSSGPVYKVLKRFPLMS